MGKGKWASKVYSADDMGMAGERNEHSKWGAAE